MQDSSQKEIQNNNVAIPSPHTGTVALFGEVLVDKFPDRNVLGGAPFNVARHLQAFCLHPVLITRTGNDKLRDELLGAMTERGMDIRGVQPDPVHPTGQVMVHMENGGHRFEILSEQAYDYIHAGVTRMIALAVQPELVYFGTLAQRHPTSRRALGSLLKSAIAPRFLDINLREPWYDLKTLKRSLNQANIIKLNNEELLHISKLLRIGGTDETTKAALLAEQFNISQVLVTKGEQGAWLRNESGAITDLQPDATQPDIHIADTVGAGDGFASVFILGLFKKWTPEQSLQRADQFARAICGIRGAIPQDDQFYAPFRTAWSLKKEDHS
ncbi:carbohydrate kinase family protein [Sulfurirhabdus autotrophica]|uniref:Fructokinase n=1 Tax=Sulfurirhabdus autotrophica TaxID=1706046 RepID=A0A4V2W323_9PROT|nr:carbohydrate kinase [Sulfurirhabdus autotrophica]TCV90299.1 fructokinase [Sulfurirhabdus autotrophica]